MNFSSEMNHCELNNDTHPHTLMFISHLSLEFTKTQNNSEDKFSDTRPVTFTCLYIFRLPYFRERNYLFLKVENVEISQPSRISFIFR